MKNRKDDVFVTITVLEIVLQYTKTLFKILYLLLKFFFLYISCSSTLMLYKLKFITVNKAAEMSATRQKNNNNTVK